ncbi:putative disease resistance protein RGA1 [Ananas comosus]|uniref:Putative disease resistance protein RGA1 n=1 Tax=Ananas comosus TaxID=4615 RepID=A0A199VGE6_ANACO|nr:putative disease resistance protein RGA1 [Ananas comosus]
MAEGIAFDLVKGVLGKLGSALWDEIGLLRSFKDDADDLRSDFSAIQVVLLDAEERSSAGKESHALRHWLRKLKDAAYDADDLLDEIRTEAEKVRGFLSRANPMHLKFKVKMAHRMKELREKIGKIAKQRNDFGLAEAGPVREAEFKRPETFSVVNEKTIVGRDSDKEEIVKLLLETNSDHNVSVIPIRVTGQQRFDLRVWVCVSTDFHMKTIAKPVISAAGENCALDNSDAVASCLVRIFSQKRFLLVLDDVWNEDQERWEKLKVLFKDGKQGSKILVTTRSEKVAEIMKTVEPHRVKGLSDDDCWTLFKRRAFKEGEENDYPSLVAIGKQIVEKCGGLPLAANALGSMMRFKSRTEDAWSAIRDNGIWSLKEEETILPSLKLSYIQMSSALKQCFAYCSIFPKDYAINKDDLIRQWIALGFISSHETWTSMEDIGNEYLNDLLWMSFLQDDVENKYTYRMHDLVHDLAQSVAREEVAVIFGEESTGISEDSNHGSAELLSLQRLSLFVVGKQDCVEHCASISELEHLKLVGQLRIKGCKFDREEPAVFEVGMERFNIVLSAEEIETVLENLQPHQKLEELEIQGYGGGKFPSWMVNRIGSRLPNLVEIKLDNIPVCSSLPPLGQLPFLKQLFIRNMPAITNLGGVDKFPALTSLDLCSMPMLREWVTVLTVDDEECRRERVPIFPCLTHLTLNECPQFSPEPCLPASVKDLDISRTSSENLSLILERATPLDGGDAAVSLQPPPNKGLRNLKIDKCQQLTCLPESLRSLTSLQWLAIWHCEDLERIEDWLGELFDLESLSIEGCSSLRYLPAHKMTALQELGIGDCPLLFDADGQFVDTTAPRQRHAGRAGPVF